MITRVGFIWDTLLFGMMDCGISRVDMSTKTILKGLDTFGSCQRPVFSLGVSMEVGVSQHKHTITNV